MITRRPLLAATVGLAVVALLATGCGSDKKTADTSAAPTESVAESTPAESTPTPTDTVAADTVAADTAAGTVAGSAPADTAAGDATATTAAGATGIEPLFVNRGKLTVCSDVPYAPFEFQGDDGSFQGVDLDIMKEIAKDIGVEADFVDTDFDGIFAALAAGKCDTIASSVTITDERKKSNDFTNGYFKVTGNLLVRKADANTFVDLASLKGKTVAVQSGTTFAEFVKDDASKTGYSAKEFTGADDMLNALKAGQVEAVLQDGPINSYQAVKNAADLAVTGGNISGSGGGDLYGFVVAKQNPGLTAKMNASIQNMQTDGRYAAIVKKYLGDYKQG